MKAFIRTYFIAFLAVFSSVILSVSPSSFARGHNPAVSNQFFESMQNLAGNCGNGAWSPLPAGSVHRVSWQQLACQIQAMPRSSQPLVVGVTTADDNLCAQYNGDPQAAASICRDQVSEDGTAAAARPDVLFLSVDAGAYPAILNGVDVRVLPSHLLIASYTDTSHYEAIKVWGFLDRLGVTSVVDSTFTH